MYQVQYQLHLGVFKCTARHFFFLKLAGYQASGTKQIIDRTWGGKIKNY